MSSVSRECEVQIRAANQQMNECTIDSEQSRYESKRASRAPHLRHAGYPLDSDFCRLLVLLLLANGKKHTKHARQLSVAAITKTTPTKIKENAKTEIYAPTHSPLKPPPAALNTTYTTDNLSVYRHPLALRKEERIAAEEKKKERYKYYLFAFFLKLLHLTAQRTARNNNQRRASQTSCTRYPQQVQGNNNNPNAHAAIPKRISSSLRAPLATRSWQHRPQQQHIKIFTTYLKKCNTAPNAKCNDRATSTTTATTST
ncbi:unnamed protein product [Ceratitis capitata]|uniref:(Mediterranean fruit fly) hypothetical protein n=1 Tax=Ceratitis capitata TaxID=7213 RepID=A0A811VGY9_CERCA|nr:unnamed protein product [Ceratitis capitata]